jgi:hypothetical protein
MKFVKIELKNKHQAHCAKLPKSIQLREFGGTSEPCMFLARDAGARGLVVPAYSKRALQKQSGGTICYLFQMLL